MVRIALLHNRNRGALLQGHHQLMRRTTLHLHATNHIILPNQLTHLLLVNASERNTAQRLQLLLHLSGFQQGCAAHRNLLSRQQGREEDQHHVQHRNNSQRRGSVQQLTGTSQRRTLLTGTLLSTQTVQARILTQTLTLSLKYGANRQRAIQGLKRISKPGLRVYAKSTNLPKVLGGLGVAILSTSSGLLTDKQAESRGVGGEVLAYVW